MRLLSAAGPGRRAHEAAHGPLRLPSARTIVDHVEAAGLLGRGGAGFPTARKMRAVAAGTSPVVLGNACEGEPGSSKDGVLLRQHPHLILDGLQVAAAAVGAREAHLCTHSSAAVRSALAAAMRERNDRVAVTIHEVPDRYVASEESALVNFVNTGVPLPTFTPPRPFERGVKGRPTLVNNAETLAHLALIARFGAEWFRRVGDPDEPGTSLVTVTGEGQRSVVEIETGTTVGSVLTGVGIRGAQAVLVGGYFGAWVRADQAWDLPLTQRDLKAVGGSLGAGILIALPAELCGLAETARIAGYLAAQNAGQCGPCFNGLPAIAAAMSRLATGPWDDRSVADLDRWLTSVPGRGACRHPDGAVRFVTSALNVFAEDVVRHRRGHRCADSRRPARFLPLPQEVAA